MDNYYEQYRTDDGMFHYLYKITNLINSKYYYGIHSTTNINDKYMGSGSLLKKSIKKYGKENFRKDILKFFSNRQELLDEENRIVNLGVITDLNSYNLSEGGKQGSKHVIVVRDEYGNPLAVSDLDPKWLSGEYVGVTKGYGTFRDLDGNIVYTKLDDERIRNGELVGLTTGYGTFRDQGGNIVYTKLDDERIRNGELVGLTTGKKHIHRDGVEKLVSVDQLDKFLSDGWKIGSPTSSASKGKIIINNGVINKHIDAQQLGEFINAGWKRGSKYKVPKGQISIHKNGVTKRIWPKDLDEFIQNGWKRGISPRVDK